MVRLAGLLLLVLIVIPYSDQGVAAPSVVTVCELSRNLAGNNNKQISVRGVFYYGIRQSCPDKCANAVWPSFLDISGGSNKAWEEIAKVEHSVEDQAKKTKKRFEIWVTVQGTLHTIITNRNTCSPRERGGFGHLNSFPSEIIVESFSDIEVKENPNSPYDYANMYHGPA